MAPLSPTPPIYFLLGDRKNSPKPFPFLEQNLLPILYSDHMFIIQHTVNVKIDEKERQSLFSR